MRKLYKNEIIFLFILILISVILYFVNTKFSEKYVKGKDYLYEVAAKYIKNDISSNNIDNKKPEFKTYISYDKFGITRKGKYNFAYMWILNDSYYKENGELKYAGGSSIFYKVKIKDDKVIDYEIPMDGSNYDKSLKKMCKDLNMYNKVINYNSKLSNDDKIEK